MNINHLGQVNMINNDIESTTSEFKNMNNNIQIKQVEKSDS
ncbi:flagellar biosynthesis protein FlaG, partial [Clostridium botulinum]|nr:flagellar biosynthesis protein FlaG [Clostridium botulinum]